MQSTNDIWHNIDNATERANVVPGVSPTIPLWQARSDVRNGQTWFNTVAFSMPASFSSGNASRTLSALRRDTFKNVDFTLTKSFMLPENKAGVTFEFEFFNLFNQTVFGTPATSVGSVNFGRVFGQSNASRLIQFALRLSF